MTFLFLSFTNISFQKLGLLVILLGFGSAYLFIGQHSNYLLTLDHPRGLVFMIIIYKLNFLWFTLLVVTIWPSSLFVIVLYQLKIRESFAPLFGDDLAV